MEERPNQTDANHDIDPWRVGITLAPLVAVAALAVRVNIEAPAEHQRAVDAIRAASWVATGVTLVWFCVVAMMGGEPRTKVGLELRMFVERNSSRNSVVAPLTLFQTAFASPDRFALTRPRPAYPHGADIGPRRQRRAHPRCPPGE